MAANDKSLRIACRLVCRDQWLVTHVDPSWPVSTLKLFLLRKFSGTASDPDDNPRAIPVSPRKARRRSLSPITFAPPPLRKAQPPYPSISTTAQLSGSEDSGDLDFDDDVNITKAFTDAHRYKYTARPSTSSIADSAATTTTLPADPKHDPNAYVLLTFSTTQLLEDRFSLAWYGIHPDELLELHPTALSFVSLPRGTLDAYIAPYFAARVWALRIVGHGSDEREDDGPDTARQGVREKREKKKIAVEWKERWAIVHQGVFSLCKERHDTHVAFSAPLSAMLSIRDSAHFSLPLHTSRLRRKSSATPTGSNVVCVKFRTRARQIRPSFNDSSVTFESNPHSHSQDRRDPSTPSLSMSSTISAGTMPVSGSGSSSGGQGAWWRKGSRDVSGALSIGLTSSASALVGTPLVVSTAGTFVRRGSGAGLDESEGESGTKREKGKGKEKDEAEDAIWIVLDMLDSSACSHILRILHRHAPHQCHSTFLPTRGASVYSPSPSPIIFSTRSSSPGSPTMPGPSSSHNLPLPPSHNLNSSQQPSPLLFPTPTGACSSYIPYKAYHFGPTPETRPPSPTLPPPGYSLADMLTAELGRGEGVPYPSWRLDLVRRARRAGLGAVGRAMELVMFGDEEAEEDEFADDEEDEELAIEWARPKRNTMSSFSPSPVTDQPGPGSRAPWTVRELEESLEMPGADEDEGDADATDEIVEESLEPSLEEENEGGEEEDLQSQPQKKYAPRWFEDLSYLEDPEVEPAPESGGSEAEWDGWVDAVVSQYRLESLARRTEARRQALAASGALDTPVSSSGTPARAWTEEWSSRFGGELSKGIAAASQEREDEKENRYDELGTWTWPRGHGRKQYQKGMGSDGDLDASTEDSSDPSASPTPHNANFARGNKLRARRGHGHAQWGRSGRTLSSYSSVDSLLRRTATMRSNIKSMSFGQMRRSSLQALFPSASSSHVHLSRQDVVDVPPTHTNSSSPSIASTVRAGSTATATASLRNRPMSPLSTQDPDAAGNLSPDAGEDGDVDEEPADVDDIDEVGADGTAEVYESEIGHGYQHGPHPVPLPGMQIVPAGYTTFQHNALYGEERWDRGARGRRGSGQREPAHAGIAHGESIQRLPLPMGMAQMMTTVSSTVSVGPSGRRNGR